MVPTGQTIVRLTWVTVPGATGYELEYQDGNRDTSYFVDDRNDRLTLELNGSPAYFVHTGRKTGTRYSYRMRAILPHTKSDWSTIAQVVTRPARPDLTAKRAAAAEADDTVILEWKRVSVSGVTVADGSPLITAEKYDIQQRASTGGDTDWTDVQSPNITECGADNTEKCQVSVDGLSADTKYYFRIRVNLDASNLGDPAVSPVMSYWDTVTVTTAETPNN